MNPISVEEYLQNIEENNKNTKDACIRYITEFNNSTSSLEQFMQFLIQSLNVHDYLLKKLSENNLQLQNQVDGLKKELSELKQTTIPNPGASSSLRIPPHINNPQPNVFASYSPQVNSSNQPLFPESKPIPTSQVPMQPINPGKPLMPLQPINPGKPIMPSQQGFSSYGQPKPIFPQQPAMQPINPAKPVMPLQPGYAPYGQPKPISPQPVVPMKPSHSMEPTPNNTNV
ncbi:hypothetical protein ENUP19_0380G0030 [Entamoeba nuttalli]|uniref:Uncharacterized protein n=2 Tax=Entamoeba nuttalli TaxID=412467 RepID=K2GY26_ENTNP|nr:hypothetical protein ENU1_157230 [Entamoeba nuttalli P19]EKE38692.1 hypothetical protein ENU1_157230 [Entamoeba nuttalli P19]|eukprot:XP_008858976.1 hypothetical protein ENU1_157230 [Entamoeba nuttalli P19]